MSAIYKHASLWSFIFLLIRLFVGFLLIIEAIIEYSITKNWFFPRIFPQLQIAIASYIIFIVINMIIWLIMYFVRDLYLFEDTKITLGIFTIILLSIPGGILTLCIPDIDLMSRSNTQKSKEFQLSTPVPKSHKEENESNCIFIKGRLVQIVQNEKYKGILYVKGSFGTVLSSNKSTTDLAIQENGKYKEITVKTKSIREYN